MSDWANKILFAVLYCCLLACSVACFDHLCRRLLSINRCMQLVGRLHRWWYGGGKGAAPKAVAVEVKSVEAAAMGAKAAVQ